MKNILIIQTAFLGDVVLATALLENLHSCLPNASISMLVRQGNESLLKNHPFLKEVIIWKKNESKFSNLISVINRVRQNKFDAVINLQRFFSSGLITALSGAELKTGFDKNPWSFAFTHKVKHIIGDGRHEVERNLQLVEFFCRSGIQKPKLYPSHSDFDTTAHFKQRPYITLAPASVWFTKQLPADKWVTLIEKAKPELKIYLVGSSSDKQLCQNIIHAAGNTNAVNLAGELSLLQTAALMKDAQMNYVNDSAPMHIASAMNAPVTAFYCSTVPGFGFGPLSDHSVIIQTNEILSCRPCGLHGKKECPLGHFKCATTIHVSTS